MSVKRAAAFMDVSERTMHRWFASGLECQKFGGKLYTTRAALQRFGSPHKRHEPTTRKEAAAERAADQFLDSIGV